MNYLGSYRRLLGNAKAAMIAAIEIYNKPTFCYRDECAVILMLNAWELALKALLSKNKVSVFYPKKHNKPYRTLSWLDALTKARDYFPKNVRHTPVQRNLELLGTYRDNAVHFYNAEGFGIVVYALAQTSIKNFRDLLEGCFGQRLEDEINWQLLPLGIRPPVDAIAYITGQSCGKKTDAVRQFLSELMAATRELKEEDEDTGRLLTIFNVKLESTKKIGDADVVVGVKQAEGSEGPLAVVRTQDPNKTHPLRHADVLKRIDNLHDRKFTSYVLQAIAWKLGLKGNLQYCWRDEKGALIKYSNEVIVVIKRLSLANIDATLKDYRRHLNSKRKKGNG